MVSDRDIAELNAAITEIEHFRKVSAGPCTGCKYYSEDSMMVRHGYANGWTYCSNPLAVTPTFDGRTNTVIPNRKDLREVRTKGGLCGPEGTLFVAKEVKKSWLTKLFS